MQTNLPINQPLRWHTNFTSTYHGANVCLSVYGRHLKPGEGLRDCEIFVNLSLTFISSSTVPVLSVTTMTVHQVKADTSELQPKLELFGK